MKKKELVTKKMDRRSFVKKMGIAAAGAVPLIAACSKQEEEKKVVGAPSINKGIKELRMVTSWPKNFPGVGTAADDFIRIIEQVSGGRYTIKLYAGGELVGPLKCLDAVQEGTADLYHSADYYYKGKDTAFAYFTSVPFGLTANEMDAWLLFAGGQELWDELSAQYGVKAFPCGNTNCQMGGWFRKDINTAEDFKGLKMRIPGLGGDVLQALGGTPVALGGAEIMPAFESGTIDATEWVGPWNDLAFGFYKVASNYYYPGFHEPGSTLSLGMSKSLWDSLNESDKAMFKFCTLAANNSNHAEFNAKNSDALVTLVNKHGVKVKEFSDDIYREVGRASKEVLENSRSSSPMTQKVYDSFMDFRKKAMAWSAIGDPKFVQKRSLYPFS